MRNPHAMVVALCLPLLAGCGVAFGAHGHGDVYYEPDGRYDDRYDHDRYERYRWDRGARPGTRLRVPRGHLPPPGACRVWLPGVPPGHQPAPGACRRLERRVPAGAWLLLRPYRDPYLIEVLVYDAYRPRVRVRYLYDARTGRRYRGDYYRD